MTVYTLTSSPLGDLVLAGDGATLSVLLPSDRVQIEPDWRRDDSAYPEAREQLARYFAGELDQFDLELAPQGSSFDQLVWKVLREIPCGETSSYGAVAAKLGRAKAARAVGGAVGRNPLLIVVPCHRVISSNGSLGGFSAGLDRKRLLLAREGQEQLAAA